jgi:hypothetical protein
MISHRLLIFKEQQVKKISNIESEIMRWPGVHFQLDGDRDPGQKDYKEIRRLSSSPNDT